MSHGTYVALSHRQRTAGVIPINDLRGSLSSKYSVAERQERCKLAALYRLVDLFGLGDGISGHISVSGVRISLFFITRCEQSSEPREIVLLNCVT